MVFKKLKDMIDKNKTRTNEKTSRRLGFSTVKDHEEWKEKQREIAREQAYLINKKREAAKIHKKVIYNRTHSQSEKMFDMIDKSRTHLDNFQKAIQPPKRKKTTKKKGKGRKKNDMESMFDF